jgi:lipooligosaccharide transport system permease protein
MTDVRTTDVQATDVRARGIGAAAPGWHAAPGWRAALLVVEGLWTWYRRNWRATLISSVLQPLLVLVAFGVGFGTLVQPSAATGGVPYLVYLAPAMLVMAAVQNAAMESTWPIISAFKWQRTYEAIIATPVTIGQLLTGQLLWITLRLLLSGAAYLAVIALFGGIVGWGALGSLLFAVLCGMAFCTPVVALSASIKREPSVFTSLFRFVVVPMTLFSGTFFPVSQLPAWGRVLAWLSPLWHGTELARGAALGTLRPLPAAGHVAYLGALLVIGVLLARWRYVKRLGV